MMGHYPHRVDWSDRIDRCNLRMGLGLVRSSISKYEGSSNMDLRASELDMMIKGYVCDEGCTVDGRWTKDGSP